MKTPIYDFVTRYKDLRPARFHMPGHKGRGPLGCEELDLTEIPGADSLYEAAGIIAESEANASALFGCPTFYSTEGSSHCIRAMLQLAMQLQSVGGGVHDAPNVSVFGSCGTSRTPSPTKNGGRFRILAARNVHKTFLSAAALLDLDVVWLPSAGGSYLSAQPSPAGLDAALTETGASAVYLTCPDYLGFLPDLRPLAQVCHARGALLLVDNAHGAYLRFLNPSRHPMDLGADLCCDSAHKTLPVLTGGAYLHVSKKAFPLRGRCHPASPASRMTDEVVCDAAAVRDALALFGSTSPSYLILQSLDLANPYLEQLPERLAAFLPKVEALRSRLRAAGWTPVGDEPLKLTLCCHSERSEESVPPAVPLERGTDPSTPLRSAQDDRPGSGLQLAAALEREKIYCEFADPDYIVFMLSPQNTDAELSRLEAALKAFPLRGRCPSAHTGADEVGLAVGSDPQIAPVIASGNDAAAMRWQEASEDASLRARPSREAGGEWPPLRELPEPVCSIRAAMLAPAETVPAGESLGRVLGRPGVSCPPAVPILMPGERIDRAAVAAFARYGIETVAVLTL